MKIYWINQAENTQELATDITTVDLQKIKEHYLFRAGVSANICYTESDFNQIANKNYQNTINRANNASQAGHHSVFGHQSISLYLSGIPKALAMVINNEKEYNTSEKSGRYTIMKNDEQSNKYYDKWSRIFTDLITDEYALKFPDFFTETKIRNLARENARYLLSIYTPASMQYTTSYRQLNYLYGFFQQEINKTNQNKFYAPIIPAMKEFCKAIEPIILPDLTETQKNRKLSLVNDSQYSATEYFGDVYCTNYNATLVSLAQLQRHRSIDYSFTLLNNDQYYVPPILQNKPELVTEWLKDCATQSVKIPQCTLVNVTERGIYEAFILKAKERQCTHAQLEANRITADIMNRYHKNLQSSNHPRATEIEQYTKGARCTFPDYKCPEPCRFAEGITMTRKI